MTTLLPAAPAALSNGDSHTLEPLCFPLWGSRLIEASAGTGKTWTIAALYLRLVLGHGGDNAFAQPLRPADILVMTFTRAATRELSDRIRARLLQAAQCFRGLAEVPATDPCLAGLLEAYPEGGARQNAAWRACTPTSMPWAPMAACTHWRRRCALRSTNGRPCRLWLCPTLLLKPLPPSLKKPLPHDDPAACHACSAFKRRQPHAGATVLSALGQPPD